MLREGLEFIDRNLELMKTLRCWPSARKRNLGIRRGKPSETLAITLSNAKALLDAVTGEDYYSHKNTAASSNTVDGARG